MRLLYDCWDDIKEFAKKSEEFIRNSQCGSKEQIFIEFERYCDENLAWHNQIDFQSSLSSYIEKSQIVSQLGAGSSSNKLTLLDDNIDDNLAEDLLFSDFETDSQIVEKIEKLIIHYNEASLKKYFEYLEEAYKYAIREEESQITQNANKFYDGYKASEIESGEIWHEQRNEYKEQLKREERQKRKNDKEKVGLAASTGPTAELKTSTNLPKAVCTTFKDICGINAEKGTSSANSTKYKLLIKEE